ncbi:ATP-dependent Clp protease proteolytic subunit [Ideonella sp. B7]|uniref:ATP-dependent Clp protease proteolytic subunit n=1 Tax=Ideonella benzenivorans TaxID=2831643 RepID=UPI001CEE05B0|nr:ATP-dependent Clp protease proteolytic subunit [Ideonella benzenivorans]MCA6217142.1 ATP-dependent Clp protease proteolytic subunit [Ideonella benzenivorans]
MNRLADAKDTPNPAEENTRPDDQFTSKSRTVMVFGEINDKLAQLTCRRLLSLAGESDKPITVLVCSPGGHVESGDAIHDMIRFVSAPVYVLGTGWVGSAAAHIYLAAPKERRLCLPNTRFLIHQPAGGAGGQATDIAIQAEQIIRTRARIAKVIAEQTGQPLDKVAQDIERDFWMNADEAVAYGIVSRVIQTQAELTQLQG